MCGMNTEGFKRGKNVLYFWNRGAWTRLELAGVHRLEHVKAGFPATAFDGDLIRVAGTVASGKLQGNVVYSGIERDTSVRNGIGECLPVAGICFFCQGIGNADGEPEPFVLFSGGVLDSFFGGYTQEGSRKFTHHAISQSLESNLVDVLCNFQGIGFCVEHERAVGIQGRTFHVLWESDSQHL